MRRRVARRSAAASTDRWLVSYADFITLLFAFFAASYGNVVMDAARGPGDGEAHIAPLDGSGGPEAPGVLPGGARVSADTREVFARAFAPEIAEGRVELSEDGRGLVLSIPEASAFPVGTADLTPAAGLVMTRLAGTIRRVPNAIRVEGHTDDVPIHTARYPSNWELSTARAVQVVASLIADGVAPDRLSAAGYAEFHPRVVNESAETRARNRRVDVVVIGAGGAR